MIIPILHIKTWISSLFIVATSVAYVGDKKDLYKYYTYPNPWQAKYSSHDFINSNLLTHSLY